MAVVKMRVYRGDSNGGSEKEYEVPLEEGMVVLDAIHFIQANYDGDLAVRWNCKAAKCGSCSAEINGMPKLTCKTRLDSLPLDKPVTVYPIKSFPIMKDLVTDVSWNYKVRKTIPPFTPAKDTEWIMYQEDVERSQEFRKCIECFLCQNVCHILRNHDKKNEFIGPRMLIKIAELEMHPLDTEDRTAFLRGQAGVGYCNITKCCTEVCPEHIHITDNAIIPLKERVADTYFDPIQWLFGRSKGGDKQ
ncbi:MAG TPA: succinate dehydrogenase/fumarate reductase iron-sulfur subunit [Thermodesulfobacteriota bacterium]|nr:succinate dehydrogenase/fumarate reductase iron-sulfur subunit [Thermodesulfobacteriota bacterium]